MSIKLSQIATSLSKKDIKYKVDEQNGVVTFIVKNEEMTIVNIIKQYQDNPIFEWTNKFLNEPGRKNFDTYLNSGYELEDNLYKDQILEDTFRWNWQENQSTIEINDGEINLYFKLTHKDAHVFEEIFDQRLNNTLTVKRDEIEETKNFVRSVVARQRKEGE